MVTVSFSVDCEAANADRCYTDSLIRVAEEACIPITWFLFVSGRSLMDNARLYHSEYFHRIPAWHEYGLHIHFEGKDSHPLSPEERASLIRVGKDVLKQVHIKPTSFRAGCYQLIPSDISVLEELGILVDSSGVPNVKPSEYPQWKDAPAQPYYPSYDSFATPGDAKLLEVPVATHDDKIGYLDDGIEPMKEILTACVKDSSYISIGCHDFRDCAETLRKTFEFLKPYNPQYVTLTQLYSLWKAEKEC